MKHIYILNFLEDLNKLMEPLKKWIQEHYNNPLIWLLLFLAGLFVFQMTYSALQKEK